MVQRQGSGFGFANIPKGGIADLVKPPTITPARGFSFSPVSTVRREKDVDESLRGAVLGALAPAGSKAALGLLSRIPGLEGLFYKKQPTAELPFTGIGEKPFYQQDEVLGREQTRRRDLIDKILPDIPQTKVPREKTLVGSTLAELLTYAPAALLDDDAPEGIDQFLKTAAASKKAGSTAEAARLKAISDRKIARANALTKDVDLTRSRGNGAYLDEESKNVIPISREVLISKDKSQRYVISEGDINVDYYIPEGSKEKTVIPKGMAYINRKLTLDDKDIPATQKSNFIDTNNPGDRAIGTFYPAVMQPDGTRKPMFVIEDPEGGSPRTLDQWRKSEKRRNWILDTPGVTGAPALGKGKSKTEDLFQNHFDSQKMLGDVLDSGHVVLQIAKEAVDSGDKQVFTKTGVLMNKMASSLNNEIDSIKDFFADQGRSFDDVIKSRLNPNQPSGNVMSVFAAANAHRNAYQNYQPGDPITQAMQDADSDLIDALNRLEQSTSGDIRKRDNSIFSFGNRDTITDNVVNRGRLIAAQIRLAYAAAASEGQTGRTLSDKDVANFLEQVGYESNVPEDIGTRTSEFIATAIRKYDRNNPLFSNLNQLSKSTEAGDVTRLNEEIASLFGVDRKRLASIQAKNQDGSFAVSEDEADQIRADIRNAINSSSGNKANSFFIFDPKSRRFIYRSYQDIFKRSADNNIDPIAVEFLKPGGYFDTFGIDKNTFLYKFRGRGTGDPQSTTTGQASGAKDVL